MTLEHMIDEALGQIRVGSRLFSAQHDVIHHRQGSHQLGAGALG